MGNETKHGGCYHCGGGQSETNLTSVVEGMASSVALCRRCIGEHSDRHHYAPVGTRTVPK